MLLCFDNVGKASFVTELCPPGHYRNINSEHLSTPNMRTPCGMAIMKDRNTIFICDLGNSAVRMLNIKQKTITTIFSKTNFEAGFSHPDLHTPICITINHSQTRLFVSDIDSHVIWQMNISKFPSTRDFSAQILCGKVGVRGYLDGDLSTSLLNCPQGLAFPDHSEDILFVCDTSNFCIRKINLLTQSVTLFAGKPKVRGFNDDIGERATFNWPRGICFDSDNNLYICDYNNFRLRKVDDKGQVTTACAYYRRSSDTTTTMGPISVTFDKKTNNLVVCLLQNISRIHIPQQSTKFRNLLRLHRLVSRQCDQHIQKRLLLTLISFQVFPISIVNGQLKQQKIIIYAKDTKTLKYVLDKQARLHSLMFFVIGD